MKKKEGKNKDIEKKDFKKEKQEKEQELLLKQAQMQAEKYDQAIRRQ